MGTSKTFKLVGGQTAEGDRAKWVEGVIEDAGCADAIAGGPTNASSVSENLGLSFDFSAPSPLNSYFTLCYSFGSEPFKLYPNLVTQVVQMQTQARRQRQSPPSCWGPQVGQALAPGGKVIYAPPCIFP